MTHLRDARLKRALEEAPDAGLQAPPRIRAAIQAAARDAVRPWWRRLWPAAGAGRGLPWSAALATVLLASLITLLWQGQEIPGARPEPAGADQGSPPAPAPPAPAAPAPAAPTPSAPPAERPAAAQRREAPAAATAAAPPPAAPLADAAAPPAAELRAREQAAGAALQRQAPPAMARAVAPLSADRWTQVRLEAGGVSVVVPRAQAGALPDLLARALHTQAAAPAQAEPAQLRLELSEGEEPLGALEWAAGGWRWWPLREGLPARVLPVEPGLSQELRDEAQRLLRR